MEGLYGDDQDQFECVTAQPGCKLGCLLINNIQDKTVGYPNGSKCVSINFHQFYIIDFGFYK